MMADDKLKLKEVINILSSFVDDDGSRGREKSEVGSSSATARGGRERGESSSGTARDIEQSGPRSSCSRTLRGKNLMTASNRALIALQTMRKGMQGDLGKKRKLSAELSSSFSSYKKSKKVAWRHRFICLAKHNQIKIPTTDSDKDALMEAGLGEKSIEFDYLDIDAEQFKDILYESFPKLCDGGGFQLCRCIPNTRQLEPLTALAHSSPAVLKERVGNARTYVLPLQRDLDMKIVIGLPTEVMEECLNCGIKFNLSDLKNHMEECQFYGVATSPISSSLSSNEFEDGLPPVCSLFPKQQNQPLEEPPSSFQLSDDLYDPQMQHELVKTVIQEPQLIDDVTTSEPPNSNVLSSEILFLKNKLTNSDYPLCISVRRSFVLDDALREAKKKKFNPIKHLKVTFVGESAVDYGGPRREFFRILSVNAFENYFYGKPGNKFFCCDITALQNREYFHLGQYLVMSAIQGGNGFPGFSKYVYLYFSNGKLPSNIRVDVDQLPDGSIKFCVQQIMNAVDNEELIVALGIDEVMDLVSQSGYRKPLPSHTLQDKEAIISAVLDYHLMMKVKSSMDQFMDGLKSVGFLERVQQHPLLWKPFFISSSQTLVPDLFRDLFNVEFAPIGSNSRIKQEQAYIFFTDFLDECHDGDVDCSLEDVLIFFTGASCIPPCGFEEKPVLAFTLGALATASTCDHRLRIPVTYDSYDKCKDALLLSFKGNDGFGGI